MFHSAAVKLTVWYLAIIMALSIGTSFALYHTSSNDLEHNSQRQIGYFGGLLDPGSANDFATLRFKQLNEDRDHLKANLIFFNLLVLVSGGAAAYALARRTLEPIENALEAQTRFTSDASHELRTPLTAMQTENEVALRNSALTKNQAVEILKSNLEEVGKLKALSEGLLALANAGGNEDLDNPVELKTVAAQAEERVAKISQLKKIQITNSVGDLIVKGNQQNLVDLVVILLDNAIKYSAPGSEVTISSKRKDKRAGIIVTDQGQGINSSDLPHIFDRFYRADNSRSKQKAEGYGLGLAIAKKIADLHNATIEVKSAPNKGSSFSVYLPLAN